MAIGHLWKEGKKSTIFQKKKSAIESPKLYALHISQIQKDSQVFEHTVLYMSQMSVLVIWQVLLGKNLKKKKKPTVVTYRIIMMPHIAVRNFPHWKWVLEGRESHPFLREIADYRHKATQELILCWKFMGSEIPYESLIWNNMPLELSIKLVRVRVIKDLPTLGFFPICF